MKDIYDIYINSLKGYKKEEMKNLDNLISEIELEFAQEDWFLINGGYGGIEYIDESDICRIPFIKNVGLYPTRKEKNNPTYAEIQALSFYVRKKSQIEKLSNALIKKYKMVTTSSMETLGVESDMAKILLSCEQNEKNIQKIK